MNPAPVSRGRRVRRASVTAGFAVFVAGFAHVVGGGAAPGPLTLTLAMLVALPVAVALAGRRADWRTALTVLVAQLVLHGLYSLGLDSGAGSARLAEGAHAHDLRAGELLIDPGTAAVHTGGHAVMTLGHLVAALLTIGALVQGDRMIDAIGRAFARAVRSLVPVFAVPRPVPALPRVRPAAAGFRPVEPALRRSGLRHRGPPCAAVLIAG